MRILLPFATCRAYALRYLRSYGKLPPVVPMSFPLRWEKLPGKSNEQQSWRMLEVPMQFLGRLGMFLDPLDPSCVHKSVEMNLVMSPKEIILEQIGNGIGLAESVGFKTYTHATLSKYGGTWLLQL